MLIHENIKYYQNEYYLLLNSGMFWEIFPEFTGEWEKDKEDFILNRVENEKRNREKENS